LGLCQVFFSHRKGGAVKRTVKVLFVLALVLILPQIGRAGDPQAHQDRPIPMGVSVSTTPSLPFIFAGTAGMRVRSLFNPDVKFILSNNHILGAVGPTLCPNTAPVGTGVVQPGTLDIGFDPGNDPFYLVGLKAFHVPINFAPGASNLVDAAIALTDPALADRAILDILGPGLNAPPTPEFASALPGLEVIKSGRTTGVTTGTVLSTNTTVRVNYGPGCGTARFVGQIVVTPGVFSAGGDSGSAVLARDTLRPVGLLFAGSPTTVLLNHILFVYLLLGVFVD